ncbi:Zn-dependent hydrolase [Natronolimnobius sp. AArcel1]|uniref:Zn-dependent hydrolase n=1 Tax=Natronolimnobius sp. AArcel1 TaxID=1679093 RepID=UPI0013E9B3FA|nr:Zn-dependent hydrolase [Natronolimnobius sp. AArcel1]NGM70528.1 Zn-dependent hydrolase [Natronolimnobius sp. AArcel1]
MTPPISQQRLQNDISTNADFGSLEDQDGYGRTALTATEANRRAREFLLERMEDAGLETRIDSVGNIVGRWVPQTADPDAAPVVTGSHLDSVPEGGIFDGPLGVFAGLESIRALQETDVSLTQPIQLVCFTEEEGQRFGDGLLGSAVATGQLSVEDAHCFQDDSGTRLDTALEEIGFQGDGRIDASKWDSWLELHVEQGTKLEDAGKNAGVVTTITGITHCYVEITGKANHAGSTPMLERSDALAAASEFILEIESKANQLATDHSESAVGTVGKAQVEPNATNVIPGSVTIGVDIRDVERSSMEELVSTLEATADRIEDTRSVDVSITQPYDLPPEPMADRCRNALEEAAATAELDVLEMTSGAAHDTMNVATVTDAGLLFAPSEDGISHNPMEWTSWDDCTKATTILAIALARLAQR